MNFYIKKIKLWFNNGTTREFNFDVNKINVITGDSETGKSSLIRIIDYCLMASETDIPPNIIGENIKWYGLIFSINGKNFTIARGGTLKGETRKMFFFSDIGIIPEEPKINIKDTELKKILSNEFSIDSDTLFSAGSSNMKSGSSISFRYFLWLFCIQRQDTLPSGHYLFDKHEDSRYKDALSIMKILDWVIGAQTPKAIILKNSIKKLEIDLDKLHKRHHLDETNKLKFKELLGDLYLKSKHLNLIKHNIYEDEDIISKLKSLIHNGIENEIDTTPSEIDSLKTKKTELQLKLRNLNQYQRLHKGYVDYLKTDLDSLAPINYIRKNFDSILTTGTVVNLIDYLDTEFNNLKEKTKKISGSDSLTLDVSDKINFIKKEIKEINSKISEHPQTISKLHSEREKYIHLGYVKSKLEDFEDTSKFESYSSKKEDLEEKISELEKELDDNPELKKMIMSLLNDSINESIDVLKIENYLNYKAFFNESENRLDLMNLNDNSIIKMPQLGSASINLFVHLAFFVALQNFINKEKTNKYIPSFLILDQVSTPYYEQTKKEKKLKIASVEDFSESDRNKLNKILQFLDDFIEGFIVKEKKFQIILLEHIPPNIWSEEKMKHYNLVDKPFTQGNKLVNPENIS